MLKLSRSLTIFSRWSPLVIPSNVLPGSHVNHWFDCENMAWFHEPNCFVSSIMRNLWSLMEHGTCSMTLISLDNLVTKWFTMISNNISNLSVHFTWCTVSDTLHQAIVSCFDQSSWTFWSFPDAICFVHISVEPIVVVTTDINVYDISLLKRSSIWDSVTNDFVDWGATTSWELIIVQGRWVSVVRYEVLVNNFINFFGGNTWGNKSMSSIDCSSGNFAWGSWFLDFISGMNWCVLISNFLERSIWHRSLCVIWSPDTIRYSSMSNKTIRERSHWPSISKSSLYLFISLLVTEFMHWPQLLKAFLGAEVTWLQL